MNTRINGKTVKIDIQEHTIGCAHDPYSATAVTLECGDIFCERFTDGLGREHVIIMRNNEIVAQRAWNYFQAQPNQIHCNNLYADLIARRYAGISFRDAENKFNEEYETDAMGFLVD